jgi:hypothetical protein
VSDLTLAAIFEAARANVQTGLSITVRDGFPEWARLTVALPIAGLQLRTAAPGYVQRLGSAGARAEVGLFLYLFARNEPELCGLLDLYRVWCKKAQITVSGQPVTLKVDIAERYTPEAGVLQERYAFVCPLTLTWSI